MGPAVTRVCAALLALSPLWGSGCNPSGARFSPASGVLTVIGTEGADAFVVSASADGSIVVNGGAVPIQGGVPTLANTVQITLEGRGGDDQLVVNQFGAPLPDALLYGGPGDDVLIGGAGNDVLMGGEGSDQAQMGAGDDSFLWFPGDGLDTVEGQAGADELVFHAGDAVETLHVYASGDRARVFRNVDSVTTDLGAVETVEVLARGGSDELYVGELTATAVTKVVLDLRGSDDAGDGAADAISVNATQGDDDFGVEAENGVIRVVGLSAGVEILGAEPESDRLALNALAGADVVDATAPATDAIQLALNGGLGDDVLLGGEGGEVFSGGDGEDTAFMGGGDDTFVWVPGDDPDVVEGGDGFDTLQFDGANVAENVEISAVGERVRFFRSVASVAMDLDDVESIDFNARGGADVIFVRDLSGTDVAHVHLDLRAGLGGDGQPDAISVLGTGGDDAVSVFDDAGGVSVIGFPVQVTIEGAEIPADSLHLFTLGGNDTVDASALSAAGIQLNADGGDDDDVLIGSDGVDVLYGGEGNDVLIGGPGVDALDGGPGDNIVIQ